MKVYEIGVYNKFVRDTIRKGEDLPKFHTVSPEFEETLYFERVADSEEHIREIAKSEWPSELDYVVEYVNKVRG